MFKEKTTYYGLTRRERRKKGQEVNSAWHRKTFERPRRKRR